MLFDPNRHEALCEDPWSASRAREAMERIVEELGHHRLASGQWPVHALDEEGERPRDGFKSLYLGTAGVLWALGYLQRAGAVDTAIDTHSGLRAADAAYQAAPDTGEVVPSSYLGEVGILLPLWRATGSSVVADRLHASIAANIPNPTNEALWGAPGTMMAAWHLWEATAEARWRYLFIENVEQLWRTWRFDPKLRCHLWTQDLYGSVVQYLGAAHGFAGNVHPLLKGASLLDDARRDVLYERCLAALRATAVFEGDAVNWPAGTFMPGPGGPRMLMQWCHGAPGIVTALSDFPRGRSAEMDELLLCAGRAIWYAGPLSKGYGLCHGTAGNGHAFLTLYQRTGDREWLDRARAFAMHSIVQRARMRRRYGQGRYTLWTGDAGLAIYLWHCLEETAGLPTLDVLQ